ncbi:hypothetical protein E7T06_01825 [Deinococcus sp. Arct2-2]|uniref:hypothetical protein n=1 Tax=Deinococcus sp. Arct2-2 TaxID=2568653 RepID=UPI0010A3FE41|nr:hypothetical protein [Deinococcus sp. Arct2-2]THF71719.1 hypothetical protein E7T06_01825 [Deinococcus sp. Arct2-2]
MEFVLVMACMTILMMVLAFLTLTREDREIVQEQLALDAEAKTQITSASKPQKAASFNPSTR